MTDPAESGALAARFTPAWWLPGPHLQTIWGPLVRPRSGVPLVREALTTPDGDELLLDHLEGPAGAPRVLLLHGLEGSSNSVYAQGLLRLLARRGLRATVLNFRSCARDPRDVRRMLPNRRARLYHSGETEDLDFVAETLARREPGSLAAAVGISLGGNALLKWLGERGATAPLRAAAAISVPFDLAAGARHLETAAGALYVRSFLRTLRPKSAALCERFPEARMRIDLPRVFSARTFWEFDDAATAPLHGFRGADDYYTRSSSLRYVSRIVVPTLALSAADDPFLPAAVLEEVARAASPALRLVATASGGHAGFVEGSFPWSARPWAEETAVDWLAERLTLDS